MTPAPAFPASSDLLLASAPAVPAHRGSEAPDSPGDFAQMIRCPSAGASERPGRASQTPEKAGAGGDVAEEDSTGAAPAGRVLRLSSLALEAVAWSEGMDDLGQPGELPSARQKSDKQVSRDEAEAMLGAWGMGAWLVPPDQPMEAVQEEPDSEVDADDAGQGEPEDPIDAAPDDGLTPRSEPGSKSLDEGVVSAKAPAGPLAERSSVSTPAERVPEVPAEAWREHLAKAQRQPEEAMPQLAGEGPGAEAGEGGALGTDGGAGRPLTRTMQGEGQAGDFEAEGRGSGRRQEKSAAAPAAAAMGVAVELSGRIKDIQNIDGNGPKEDKESAGIGVAESGAAMPFLASTPAAADLSGLAHASAQPSGVEVSGRDSGGVLQPEAAAARLVAAVVEVVESQVDARLSQAPSVSLRVNIGSEDVAIRVQVREGAVHTEFRTESAELRQALQHEWAAVRAEPAPGGIRFLEPEFSGNGFGSGQGWTGGGEGQGRPAHSQSEPAAFARTLAKAGAEAGERAAGSRAASSAPVHHSSRHLSAVA